MTPRRVLMTADAVGGVWTYALELARGLAHRRIEVMLAVLGPTPDDGQRAEAAEIRGLTFTVTGLTLEWQDQAGPLNVTARQKLLALEHTFHPDLVHSNSFREAAAGFRAPVLLAAHSCVATWWKSVRGGALPPDWSGYAAGVRQGLAAADALVAPSHAFAAEFAGAWETSPSVVPNGLGLSVTATPKQPHILAAGRLWDEAKNIAALATVAPDLPWPILVAGEGAADGLRHLGRLSRPELHRCMEEAAIFAAPARYEPFGLAILEAAASGCALVLGDIPTLRELWDGAAMLVAPDRPEALRDTLLRLTLDEALREELQSAARKRAQAYSLDRMVDGCVALYAGLLTTRGRRTAA